jgi:hypothetical protein
MVISAVSCVGVRGSESCRVPPPPAVAGSMPAFPAAAGPTRPNGVDGDGRAGNGNGGRGLPALAQAARATCRLARVPPLVGGLF